MDRRYFFERNLLALSAQNPRLCSRLSAAQTTLNRYKFLQSVSGEIVPALADHTGSARPLHSMVDPKKEAHRLMASFIDSSSPSEENFIVFLGLGAGLIQEAALHSGRVSGVMVIDFDINGIAELFCSREYISLLGDPRFTLLVDPSPECIENALFEFYRPAICGGIKVLPLRTRTDADKHNFGLASGTIQRTIEKVSADYSVQAHFGTRWFSNIIRNIGAAQDQNRSIPPVREAIICAAGPSLDDQIPYLLKREKSSKKFFIAADTALPALLYHGLMPDAVVSIDCQHISYYHFIGTSCRDIPLFLDITSPPMLAQFSETPFFFSGGHPLAAYISQEWRPLPQVDTSGGNVTFACLSLAENLGAQRISVYGADFSYPLGKMYARGTYIYPYFEHRQERRAPLEAHLSSFLYRSPFIGSGECCVGTLNNGTGSSREFHSEANCYVTEIMHFYRRCFEEKASAMEAEVTLARSRNEPLVFGRNAAGTGKRITSLFAPGKALMGAAEFLERYKQAIAALPVQNLTDSEKRVFTTLLPQAAAIKRRCPEMTAPELLDAVKSYCINKIKQLIPEH
ncbi:MAG: DUF115 domain-containing protein [Treponema sp.]|nr:DUF115 domain-containing protein [Treponema sp.]